MQIKEHLPSILSLIPSENPNSWRNFSERNVSLTCTDAIFTQGSLAPRLGATRQPDPSPPGTGGCWAPGSWLRTRRGDLTPNHASESCIYSSLNSSLPFKPKHLPVFLTSARCHPAISKPTGQRGPFPLCTTRALPVGCSCTAPVSTQRRNPHEKFFVSAYKLLSCMVIINWTQTLIHNTGKKQYILCALKPGHRSITDTACLQNGSRMSFSVPLEGLAQNFTFSSARPGNWSKLSFQPLVRLFLAGALEQHHCSASLCKVAEARDNPAAARKVLNTSCGIPPASQWVFNWL